MRALKCSMVAKTKHDFAWAPGHLTVLVAPVSMIPNELYVAKCDPAGSGGMVERHVLATLSAQWAAFFLLLNS